MNLLILCQSQFGYHLDTYYYAKYLSKFNVHYICWDYGLEKKQIDKVNISYVARRKGKLLRFIEYFRFCSRTIKAENPDRVFIKYFKFCFLLRLLHPSTSFVFDVRTGDVSGSKFKAWLNDSLLKFESKFFANVSVISESLRKRLNLSTKSFILPLGAEKLDSGKKLIEKLKLIYIGTLSQRDLWKVVDGIKLYVEESNDNNISLDIVGSGWGNEEAQLKELINTYNLSDKIRLHGFVHHDQLSLLLKKANIGVSFIPINDAFDVQPPTKTFEYLLSEILVIATDTKENRKTLENFPEFGLLIDDTPQSFCNALGKIHTNLDYYNARVTANRFDKYQWSIIVGNLEKKLVGLSR